MRSLESCVGKHLGGLAGVGLRPFGAELAAAVFVAADVTVVPPWVAAGAFEKTRVAPGAFVYGHGLYGEAVEEMTEYVVA